MYKLNYDGSKNRIYGTLEGFIKVEEAKQYTDELKKCIDGAKPGFTAIFNVAGIMVLSQDVTDIIAEGKKYAASKGLAKSALIMNSAILKMQVNRTMKDIGNSQEGYFDSVSQAEEFLDQ